MQTSKKERYCTSCRNSLSANTPPWIYQCQDCQALQRKNPTCDWCGTPLASAQKKWCDQCAIALAQLQKEEEELIVAQAQQEEGGGKRRYQCQDCRSFYSRQPGRGRPPLTCPACTKKREEAKAQKRAKYQKDPSSLCLQCGAEIVTPLVERWFCSTCQAQPRFPFACTLEEVHKIFMKHPEVVPAWEEYYERKARMDLALSQEDPRCFWCEKTIPMADRHQSLESLQRSKSTVYCNRECCQTERKVCGFYYFFSLRGNEQMRQIAEKEGERPGREGRSHAMHLWHEKQRQTGYQNHWRKKQSSVLSKGQEEA